MVHFVLDENLATPPTHSPMEQNDSLGGDIPSGERKHKSHKKKEKPSEHDDPNDPTGEVKKKKKKKKKLVAKGTMGVIEEDPTEHLTDDERDALDRERHTQLEQTLSPIGNGPPRRDTYVDIDDVAQPVYGNSSVINDFTKVSADFTSYQTSTQSDASEAPDTLNPIVSNDEAGINNEDVSHNESDGKDLTSNNSTTDDNGQYIAF
jgi:hypothetical protein